MSVVEQKNTGPPFYGILSEKFAEITYDILFFFNAKNIS